MSKDKRQRLNQSKLVPNAYKTIYNKDYETLIKTIKEQNNKTKKELLGLPKMEFCALEKLINIYGNHISINAMR